MILARLEDRKRYEHAHPLLKALFDFLETHNLQDAPTGRIDIAGNDLFINVSEIELRPKEVQPLEVHRRYLDVQIPLLRPEVMGWSPLKSLQEPNRPFDSENDYALYTAPASVYFTVNPGEFTIFFPEDAHAPIIGSGIQRKLIAKIKL
ncbi:MULTISPECIES: YhcH/YjgK/YiaL family protein [Prevotellaceae]|uniref:YhcH/YjgK/YiaL family protein n=1 Tax=Prevotellaceae TaxID=171552 RepID=UPI0003D3412B|nr:YhcH/YjgK/YiaL family protein [Prevotella phocaeensis]ETD19949.1 hypothetical protein HMPREF1199_00843 [Hoylesella oralis CC98A]